MIRLADRLKQERKRQGLSIEQVAKETKIRPEFLKAIEEGEYKKLPGSSYAQGFVKNYIEYLNLPVKENLAMFRREFNEREYIDVLPESFVKKEEISLSPFRFSRLFGVVALVVVAVVVYLFFQYRSAFFSPSLQVSTPAERARVSSQTVQVQGLSDPNTTVTVNGLPVYVDNNGHFSKEIPVFPGNVTITVKAANSFGKVSEIDRHITVLIGQ